MDPAPSKKKMREKIFTFGKGGDNAPVTLLCTRLFARDHLYSKNIENAQTTRQSRAYGTLNYWVYIFGTCSYRNDLFTALHMYTKFAD